MSCVRFFIAHNTLISSAISSAHTHDICVFVGLVFSLPSTLFVLWRFGCCFWSLNNFLCYVIAAVALKSSSFCCWFLFIYLSNSTVLQSVCWQIHFQIANNMHSVALLRFAVIKKRLPETEYYEFLCRVDLVFIYIITHLHM